MEFIAIEPLSDEDYPRRSFYLSSSEFLDNLAKEIEPTSRWFGLFLALDARGVQDITILDFARQTTNKGLACLCAWGPGCERVHDLFDEIICDQTPDQPAERVIMTTCHDDEPLTEALWYFAISPCIADEYWKSCTDWIAGCVGNQEWEGTIRNELRRLAKHGN